MPRGQSVASEMDGRRKRRLSERLLLDPWAPIIWLLAAFVLPMPVATIVFVPAIFLGGHGIHSDSMLLVPWSAGIAYCVPLLVSVCLACHHVVRARRMHSRVPWQSKIAAPLALAAIMIPLGLFARIQYRFSRWEQESKTIEGNIRILTTDADAMLRAGAADRLGELGLEEPDLVLPALRQAAQREPIPQVKQAIQEAIARLEQDASRDP